MHPSVVLPFPSLPALFLHTCEQPGFPGWYARSHDSWQHYGPELLRSSLKQAALGLRALGLKPGQGLGLIAPSSPRWMLLDLAAQVCGASTVPLFPNISSENFSFQVQDAPVSVLVVQDLRELDAPLRALAEVFPLLLSLESEAPRPEGSWDWETLLAQGALIEQREGDAWFAQRLEALQSDDIFSIIYTSGSTGQPKGVPLTHRHMLSQVENICAFFPLDPAKDQALSVLPVAHVFERMAIYYYLRSGIGVYFADGPSQVGSYLAELKPSVLTVVPRILEKLAEKLSEAPSRTIGPKKWLLQWAIRVARTSNPEVFSWRRALLEPLVYRKMRAALGDNFRYIVSGSSALNATVSRFLLNVGFPVFEGYGLTECSPVVAASHPGHRRLGSVGTALAHLDVRISPEGEVQVRGDSVFAGYHNRPDLEDSTFTPDGWFRTGDKGSLEPGGYLRLTGRLKEMLKTSTGKYVSPVPIELELARHPLIAAAQVFADNRKFASALLFLENSTARQLLAKPGRLYNAQEALRSRRVNGRIARHVLKLNRKLNEWEHIRKWVLVVDEPTVENGLLTPTLKLRRAEVEQRYMAVIDNLYGPV